MNQLKLVEPVSNPMWHSEIFHIKFSPNIYNSISTRKRKSNTTSSAKFYVLISLPIPIYIYFGVYICLRFLNMYVWLDCGWYCASKTTDGCLTKTAKTLFFSNDFSSEEKNKPNQNKTKNQKKPQHKPHHLTVGFFLLISWGISKHFRNRSLMLLNHTDLWKAGNCLEIHTYLFTGWFRKIKCCPRL